MVEITYQMVLSTLQTIALIVGVLYYVTTMRNQNKARQLQALNNVFSRGPKNFKFLEWDLQDYEEFRMKYFDENDVESVAFRAWWDIQEELGVYLKEGLVDVRLIYLFMSGTVTKVWEKYWDFIVEYRKRNNWPRFFIESEYVYNKIMDYAKTHPELKT
jgi:hypothetical protein